MEKLADNNSAAWMKENGTLDEKKIKEFLEQSERIYQAGKDAMDELKAAYPQAFDDSEQPVYERAGSISGETAVLLSRNCEFALGDIFFAFRFCICKFYGRDRYFLVLCTLEWADGKLFHSG